jgi:hypothetical protein
VFATAEGVRALACAAVRIGKTAIEPEHGSAVEQEDSGW